MRITKQDIEVKESTLNALMSELNIDLEYSVSFRNSYVAIDYKTSKSKHFNLTLDAGLSNREAYYILKGMIEALYVVTNAARAQAA